MLSFVRTGTFTFEINALGMLSVISRFYVMLKRRVGLVADRLMNRRAAADHVDRADCTAISRRRRRDDAGSIDRHGVLQLVLQLCRMVRQSQRALLSVICLVARLWLRKSKRRPRLLAAHVSTGVLALLLAFQEEMTVLFLNAVCVLLLHLLACVFEVLQVALLGPPAIAALVAALAVATVVLLRAEDASPLICATSAALSAFAAIIFAYIFALAIAVPAVTSLKELATVMVGVLLLKGRAQSWTRFAAQSLIFVGAVSSWGPFWGAYLLLPPRMVDVSYECNRLSKWGAVKRTVLRTSFTPLLRRLALLQMSQQWGPMRVIMHVAMHVLDLALSYVMVAVWGFLSPVAIWVLPKPSPRSVWEFAFHVGMSYVVLRCARHLLWSQALAHDTEQNHEAQVEQQPRDVAFLEEHSGNLCLDVPFPFVVLESIHIVQKERRAPKLADKVEELYWRFWEHQEEDSGHYVTPQGAQQQLFELVGRKIVEHRAPRAP